ncbi:hypothetical protein FVF58_26050 [Paraburkholderia panacisoli]|uniref:Uncharacterized protein n=1 Tax=Paraburkholderia panacisoli TaxID=2603818 RepID=A0A5B0GUE0_9BURK|nr:hypothetical protein FVF58_26050 [Paraburkholderia panacisoli]
MGLWIQPRPPCADLFGQPAAVAPDEDLTLNGAGAVNDARVEEHYTCSRCRSVFARILAGPPQRQIWMLLNARPH